MKKYFDLTFPQKSILLVENFYKNTNINNICGHVTIKNRVDFAKFKIAMETVIKSNQSFWIRYVNTNEGVKQYVSERRDLDVKIVDLKNEDEIESLEEKIKQKCFDIYNERLFEVIIFRLPRKKGGFIFNGHHLNADSWGLGLFCRKLMSIYNSLLKDEKPCTEGLDYTDFIQTENNYKNSERYKIDRDYWIQKFKDNVNPATLPSDIMADRLSVSSIGERISFFIPKSKMKLISAFCAQNKISNYTFLLAIYSIYFSKVINSDNFSFGTPILNRTNQQEKNTIGMYVNVVPCKVSIDVNSSIKDYMHKVASDSIGMLKHQRYPYNQLLEDLRKDDPNVPNLYNIVISYQITKTNENIGIDYKTRWGFDGTNADDLTIQFMDLDDKENILVDYDFKKIKFSKEYIRNMHSRILEIVSQVIENPDIIIKDIEVVNRFEKDKILNKFNNTKVKYNKSLNVIRQFEDVAAKNKEKIAIISNKNKITYEKLDEKSNMLANYLAGQGVKPKDVVAIMMNRNIDLAVGLLAILKTGATYLPIDPEYPKDRIDYMLGDSNTKLVLVNNKTCGKIDSEACKEINIEKNNIYKNMNKLDVKINPEDLIYVIYTSGSTGKPKGVMLKHKNITNFLVGMKDIIDFDQEKIMCSITTICFDIFVLEFWGSLTSGMTLVLANEEEQSDFEKLNELCINEKVDIIQTTPSRYKHMLEILDPNNSFLNDLKDLLVGGEGLPKFLVETLKKYTNAKIFNMYGPTETAVWSTVKRIKDESQITIGYPIANTTCYILNKDKNLMPPYVPGELYIGGDGVSKGYLNRKSLTEEKFVKSKFDGIIYNTNDLAYFKDNGEIVHLGRTDFQIKIRGYRIELEEIESKIIKYPGIKNVVVSADKDNKYLICFYVSDDEIDTKKITEYLLKDMPNYMVPSVYYKLKEFTLTQNGKLDRKKLPNIKVKDEKTELANTKTEKIISKVVSEVINDDNVDINMPFIALGLDSLGIIQVQTKLLNYKYILNTQDFYKYNNIKSLAEHIDNNIYTYPEKNEQVPIRFRHTDDEILAKISQKVNDARYLGNVFLTGANGFIGIHILHELLSKTNIKIYCLVREKKDSSSVDRIDREYKFYFSESIKTFLNKRVFILDGDITEDSIGLSKKNVANIIKNCKTIIHTAARVKHYGDYDIFYKINTNGTKNVAEFALSNKLRFIHISSISVSGNYLVKQDNRNIDFSENSLYIGQKYTDNVYVNTKFEAEKQVLDLMEKGLDAQIHRIGILSGRYKDGVFQENIFDNAFYNRIKSIVVLGKISEDMLDQNIEFTPVDLCVRSIVALAKNKICDGKIYHLYNHNFIKIRDIVEVLNFYGQNIEIVSNKKFKNNMLKVASSTNSNNLYGIINDIENSDDKEMILNYNYSVNIKSNYTRKYLHLLRCDWNKTDSKYLKKIVSYMKKVKFI